MGSSFRYLFLAGIVLVCLVSDQWSKHWAEGRLSAPYLMQQTGGSKSFVVEVPAEAKGQSVHGFLKQDLTGTPEAQVLRIAQGGHKLGASVNFDKDKILQGGESLEITAKREVVVVEDYFTFRYARNPGAAFSFLASADGAWKKYFFIVVSIVAMVIVFTIYRRLTDQQRLLMFALSLIVGGALGNFVDRLRFGWVIDFISWHYQDKYVWPTFNLADSYITLGDLVGEGAARRRPSEPRAVSEGACRTKEGQG
jgi:signal peptidase II